MAWKRPPKDASDQLLAEEYHWYRTAPGRGITPSVTKIIKPLADTDILSQAKAKLTASIAALEDDQRPQRTINHRKALQIKYDGWKSWQHAKYEKVDLSDDAAVYYDWLRSEATRRWGEKADRGSRVHAHVYDLALGQDVEALDDELPYLAAWHRWVEECDVEFIPDACERVVVHPWPNGDDTLEYGGRDDLFCIQHAGPIQGLLLGDVKTGGKYPTQVTLQLAAYMRGLGFAKYDDSGQLLPDYDTMPAAERAVAIYLREDESYECWEAPVDGAFEAFLDLRRVVNFRKTMEPHEKKAEAEWKERN